MNASRSMGLQQCGRPAAGYSTTSISPLYAPPGFPFWQFQAAHLRIDHRRYHVVRPWWPFTGYSDTRFDKDPCKGARGPTRRSFLRYVCSSLCTVPDTITPRRSHVVRSRRHRKLGSQPPWSRMVIRRKRGERGVVPSLCSSINELTMMAV